MQVDDLIQSGMIGLLEAAGKYDESYGASFDTYAGIRIRGSMLDEIRKCDLTPRSVHRKSREISAKIQELSNKSDSAISEDAVAKELGMSLASTTRQKLTQPVPKSIAWTNSVSLAMFVVALSLHA